MLAFPCVCSQDRADGTNVNNWHWTEKDVGAWARQRLSQLLGGLTLFSDAAGSATTTSVESVKGAEQVHQWSDSKGHNRQCRQSFCCQWAGPVLGSFRVRDSHFPGGSERCGCRGVWLDAKGRSDHVTDSSSLQAEVCWWALERSMSTCVCPAFVYPAMQGTPITAGRNFSQYKMCTSFKMISLLVRKNRDICHR